MMKIEGVGRDRIFSKFDLVGSGRVDFFSEIFQVGSHADPSTFSSGRKFLFDPGRRSGRVEGRENFVRGKFKGEWVRVKKEIGSILSGSWLEF
jgi:hypothetical protein